MAPEVEAAEAGLGVLESGGNAVDAAVAAAFVQGIVNPMMCGIGGFGTLVVAEPGRGPRVLDFASRAGSAVRPDQWASSYLGPTRDAYGYRVAGNVNEVGYGSIGIPTAVAGLGVAHERWGSLAWADLLEPAIRLAANGFEVAQASVDFWARPLAEGRLEGAARLCYTPATAAIYAPSGRPVAPGDLLVQHDQAAVLERIASLGWQEFYDGETGERIGRDLASNGGTVTRADLRSYRPRESGPLRSAFRGLEVFGAGEPAGGRFVAAMLAFLEAFDVASLQAGSAEHLRLVVEAMTYARGESARHDADAVDAPLWDPAGLRESVAIVQAGGRLPPGPPSVDDESTTHLIAIDGDGMVASLTHSLGYSSGVVTPGLGFLYNNYLNCFNPLPGRTDSLEPGRSRPSSTAPTIVFDDGAAKVVAGAPGATRIAPSVAQVLVNIIDLGMGPVEAVSAPRVDRQAGPVHLEGRIPRRVQGALVALGYETSRSFVNYDRYFARPQVAVRGEGGWVGASDPRGDGGTALAPGLTLASPARRRRPTPGRPEGPSAD